MSDKIFHIFIFDDLEGGESKVASPLRNLPNFPADVIFFDLHGKDVIETVKEAIHIEVFPDVILIDHVLNQTSPSSISLLKNGSSIVPILHERWPITPIIAITADSECSNRLESDIYEEVFDRKNFSELGGYLPHLIEGYRSISKVCSIEQLMDIMAVPEKDRRILPMIIPDLPQDEKDWRSPKFIHKFYRWFRNTMHKEPGFLYDKSWLGVTLGISQKRIDSFESNPEINKCKYNGIWATPSDPRWWKAELYDYIRDNCVSCLDKTIQEAACELFDISPEDYSNCYSCGNSWPEILAYTDLSNTAELHPMHLKCSQPHPTRQSLTFFEEKRVIMEDA